MDLDLDRDTEMLYDYFRISFERHAQIHDRIMEFRENSRNMGEVIEKIIAEYEGNNNELVYALVEYGVLRGKDGGLRDDWLSAFLRKWGHG